MDWMRAVIPSYAIWNITVDIYTDRIRTAMKYYGMQSGTSKMILTWTGRVLLIRLVLCNEQTTWWTFTWTGCVRL